MKRRHWFHCSSIDHGPVLHAVRRAPLLRAAKEPLTPGVCVAPSVAACFAAVLFNRSRPVFVYRTEKEQRGVAPVGVWDQFLTRERWLIPPVRLVLDRVVPSGVVDQVQGLMWEYHELTGNASNIVLRFAQFAIAVEVLGGSNYEKRVVFDLKKKWGWSDPRSEIICWYLKWEGRHEEENGG